MDIREKEIRYKNQIKRFLAGAVSKIPDKFVFYGLSTDEEDTKQSFDAKFNLSFKVSVRIRANKYLVYSDLTIRSRSKMGFKTEIDKIKEGMGDIYVYAYENIEGDSLIKAYLIDIDSVRLAIENNKYFKRKNNDGTEFITIRFKDLIILKES